MGGLLRFLLGGVLGAALGVALARRRTLAPRKSGLYPPQRVETPVSPEVEAPAPAGAESFAPAVIAPTAPQPIFAREAVEAAAPPVVPAPSLAPPKIETAPEGSVFPLRPPMVEETMMATATPDTVALEHLVEEVPEVEVSEVKVSEIVVTPEILEEPVPGTGWSPSAVLEEEAFESVLPVIPEEVIPQSVVEDTTEAATWAGAEAPSALAGEGRAEAPSAEPVVEIPVVQDLRARIEATRRRIREELERPFVTDFEMRRVPPSGPVSEAEAAAPQAARGVEAVVAPQAARGVEAVASQPAAGQPVLETKDKAEETRFKEEIADTEATVSATGSAPPSAVAPTPAGSALGQAPSASVEAQPQNFEAVKMRIELARNRLKAKAFDAMMAGESALLARDDSGARPQPVKLESVDREIDQTIETTLREHED